MNKIYVNLCRIEKIKLKGSACRRTKIKLPRTGGNDVSLRI